MFGVKCLLSMFGKNAIAFLPIASSIFIATFFINAPAVAGVYKYIDENGQVAYSDKPVAGAEKLKIRSRNSPSYAAQPSRQNQSNNSGSTTDTAFEYDSFELLTPKNEKVVSDRSGSVQVIFLPTPTLANDHQIIVTVDGKDISRGRHANISLSQVPRGSHKVEGRIEDADGQILIKSGTVTFHVKRPIIDEDSPLAFTDN